MEKLEVFKMYLQENHNFEEIKEDEIEVNSSTFIYENVEVNIFNKEERWEELGEHLYETASYFDCDFLEKLTGIPSIAFQCLQGENEAVYAIIEATCGASEVMCEAIRLDGYGNFLSPYDSEETEIEGYYIYVQNM